MGNKHLWLNNIYYQEIHEAVCILSNNPCQRRYHSRRGYCVVCFCFVLLFYLNCVWLVGWLAVFVCLFWEEGEGGGVLSVKAVFVLHKLRGGVEIEPPALDTDALPLGHGVRHAPQSSCCQLVIIVYGPAKRYSYLKATAIANESLALITMFILVLLRSKLYLWGSPFRVRSFCVCVGFKSNHGGSHIPSSWMVHAWCFCCRHLPV